jgi:hypothetical protein
MSVAIISRELVTDSTTTPGARLTAAAVAKRQGLTGQVWSGFNAQQALLDPGYGSFHLERFRSGVDAFTLTQATTGTAVPIAGPDGFGALLELDAASNTVGQGVQIQYKGLLVNPVAGMEIMFETMARVRDISTTGIQHFLGLSDVDTTIHASALPTTGDKIGFASITTNLISEFVMNASGVPAAATGTPHTWVDADVTSDGSEWAHLAFKWKVDEYVRVFVNGAEFGNDLAISTDPAAAVCPSFVAQVAATNVDSIMELAYFAFGYKYPA